MKVLVAGGSGFVGSHVADALAEAGHEVTIFDVRPYAHLRSDQTFLQGDTSDSSAVAEAVKGQEAVYNFAGLADIEESQKQPLETVRVNVLGNVILLDAARLAKVQRYIFASTIYVYSESGGFYRASKQACEGYIEEYQREYGLDYTVLRYGSLYGRRADERNSIHRYLKEALLTRKVLCYGTGEELREYIHVEDAARCSVEVLAQEYRNQYVILTGHHPMKLRDLVNMIREIVGDPVEIEFRPPEPPTDGSQLSAHYAITPYSFRPRIGKKLVSHYYVDLGQGLLDCLHEIYEDNLLDAGGDDAPANIKGGNA